MGTVKSVILIITALIDLIKYITRQIDLHEYNKRVKKMRDAISKATSGGLEDRVKGGRDVEDQFNTHAS